MIARIATLIAVTVCYWLFALGLAGGAIMGDCGEDAQAACSAGKGSTAAEILIASGLLYLMLIGFLAWGFFRRPR